MSRSWRVLLFAGILGTAVVWAQEPADSDGDGLSDNYEQTTSFTSPTNPDTDGDGMSDGFEVTFGLNPLSKADAALDADGDSVSNLEEFQGGSDPLRANDPAPVYFVGESTVTKGGGSHTGSQVDPFPSIEEAIDELRDLYPDNPPTNKIRIILFPGTYAEDVNLFPGLGIAGQDRFDCAIIGRIDLAAGSDLFRLTAIERTFSSVEDNPLVIRMDDGPITLREVDVRGSSNQRAVGLKVEGDAQDANTVIDSTFVGLRVGIEIRESIPRITRNVFDQMGEHGIVFRLRGGPGGGAENSLGDVTDAYSGFNSFKEMGGFAVINERDESIRMQNNDWGISDLSHVDEVINGQAVVPPVLAPAGQVVAGAIACTVWDARNQQRITNASVRLEVTSFDPISNNEDGVYAYPSVNNGSYTLIAVAPGFQTRTLQTTVSSGRLSAVVIPMAVGTSGEGEGEGEGGPDAVEVVDSLSADFEAADGDGDGAIDFEEAGLALPGLTRDVFDSLDTNADGTLEPGELGIKEEQDNGCGCGTAKKLLSDPLGAAGDAAMLVLSALVLLGYAGLQHRMRGE